MITINEESIPYKEGMSASDAIAEVGADTSLCIVLINDVVVRDAQEYCLSDGDAIKLLKIVSGG